MDHMSRRLDDHRADAQRPDAVLDHPSAQVGNPSTGNLLRMQNEVACHAFHVSQRRAMSVDPYCRRLRDAFISSTSIGGSSVSPAFMRLNCSIVRSVMAVRSMPKSSIGITAGADSPALV